MIVRKKALTFVIICLLLGSTGIFWKTVVNTSRGAGTVLGAVDVEERINDPRNLFSHKEAWRALQVVSAPAIETGDTVLSMRGLQLRLPEGYEVSKQDSDSDMRLAASARKDGLRKLSIVSEEHVSIDDIPAVQMRRSLPQVYKEESMFVDGVSTITFTSATAEHFEKVVFAKRGSFVTSFAMSTDAAFVFDIAKQEIHTVLQGVQWVL